jgi:ADP-heptose:LPS heptosyltransferase
MSPRIQSGPGLSAENYELRMTKYELKPRFAVQLLIRHSSFVIRHSKQARETSALPGDPIGLRRQLESIPRILLIRLRSLGDSILTLPLIEALHRWRPDLEIDVLIEEPFAPIFLTQAAVHETLIVRARNGTAAAGWDRIRAIFQIRRRHYPAVFNLHGGTTSLLFEAVSGAPLRIGQKDHRNSWVYNAQVPSSSRIWKRQSLHTVEHQLSIMRWLGLPVPTAPSCSLPVNEEAMERTRERLGRAAASQYFVVHPTATLDTKQWNTANFAQLGDLLWKQFRLPVIYTSAAHESAVLKQVRQQAEHENICFSDLSLEDLIALISASRLFIGNDSGPTHIAAALRRPIVVVWGSSNFQAWHPWGTEYEAVRSDLPCMPCPGYQCKVFERPRCIGDITVSKVFEACVRIMNRT